MIVAWPSGLVMFVAVLGGVFGLAVGSFLNVVVYRVPSGKSIVAPPSSCPRCGAPIRPYDNIPVVSWLLLGGKCRTCKVPISVRYPLVEAGAAFGFFAVALKMFPSGATDSTELIVGVLTVGAFLYLAAVSIALGLIDIDVHRLPNVIVLPGYFVGAALLGAAGFISDDLAGVVRAGIGMALLWFAYYLLAVLYPGGMGFGDVKLAGMLGLFLGFLGWQELAVGAFAAFLLGGIFALGLVVTRRANRKSGIPFGPWMLAGAWVGIFFGSAVWDGYLNLLGVA